MGKYTLHRIESEFQSLEQVEINARNYYSGRRSANKKRHRFYDVIINSTKETRGKTRTEVPEENGSQEDGSAGVLTGKITGLLAQRNEKLKREIQEKVRWRGPHVKASLTDYIQIERDRERNILNEMVSEIRDGHNDHSPPYYTNEGLSDSSFNQTSSFTRNETFYDTKCPGELEPNPPTRSRISSTPSPSGVTPVPSRLLKYTENSSILRVPSSLSDRFRRPTKPEASQHRSRCKKRPSSNPQKKKPGGNNSLFKRRPLIPEIHNGDVRMTGGRRIPIRVNKPEIDKRTIPMNNPARTATLSGGDIHKKEYYYIHVRILHDDESSLNGWRYDVTITDITFPECPIKSVFKKLRANSSMNIVFKEPNNCIFSPAEALDWVRNPIDLYLHTLHVEVHAVIPAKTKIVDTLVFFGDTPPDSNESTAPNS